MKKGLILLLSTSFLIAAPSLIQAEEIGNPVNSLSILTKNQSLLSSVKQGVVSTVSQVSEVITNLPVISVESVKMEESNKGEAEPLPEAQLPDVQPTAVIDATNPPNSANEVCVNQPTPSNDKGLLNLETDLPVVGDVELDLLSQRSGKTESIEKPSKQGGLLVLKVKDSLLLGDINAGVLTGNTNPRNEGHVISDSLAAINVSNFVGDIQIAVGENITMVSGETSNTSSGLLSMDLTGSLLGNTHLGLVESNDIVTPNKNGSIFSGLITADLDNLLTGDIHIGLLENYQTQIGDGILSSGGLIVIDLVNSLLGGTEIVVGEYENDYNNRPPPNSVEEDDDSNSEENSFPPENYDREGSGSESDAPIRRPNTGNDEQPIDSQSELIITEDQNIDFNNDEVNFIHLLTAFDNKNAANQIKEIKPTDLMDIMNSNNEHSTGLLMTAELSTAPSASSGSASAGSSSSSGGSGVAAYLHNSSVNHASSNYQMQSDYKDLSNQWIEAPQIGPPQKSFFLSNI